MDLGEKPLVLDVGVYCTMNLIVHRGAPREYKDLDTGEEYFSVSQVLDVLEPDAFKYVSDEVLEATKRRGEKLHMFFSLILGAYTTKDSAGRQYADGLQDI